MSPEEEADYKRRVSEKLKRYKISSGLYLEPEDEDMCQKIMEKAQQLMKRGRLQEVCCSSSSFSLQAHMWNGDDCFNRINKQMIVNY